MTSESVTTVARVGFPPMSTPPSDRTLRIPEDVARQLEGRIAKSAFRDLDSYVGFVLARLLEVPSKEPFSEEDERRLRERLRSLGYID